MKTKLFFVGCGLLGLSTLVHADVWRLETIQPQSKTAPLQTKVSLKLEHGLIPLSEIIGTSKPQKGLEDAWFSNNSAELFVMMQPEKTTARLLSVKVEDAPSTITRMSNYTPEVAKQILPAIKKTYKEKTVYMPLSGGFGMAEQAPQKIRFYPFE